MPRTGGKAAETLATQARGKGKDIMSYCAHYATMTYFHQKR